MPVRVRLTIILFSISFHSFSQIWQELNDSLIQYYNSGEYGKGVVIGEKAVKVAKIEFGENHPNYARSLSTLGLLYHRLSQYTNAEPLYIEALSIRKKAFGENHPYYATSLNNLAGLYESNGKYAESELLHIEAMGIRGKTLGSTHPDYAESLNNLAVLYAKMGQYAKSEPLYLEAIIIRKKVLGSKHAAYASTLNNLAVLYQSMGLDAKAEPLYIETINIWKEVLGETHPHYAASLNNLAEVYKSIGQYAKAEMLYIQSMTILRITLGETHPDYASSLDNLASLYKKMGLYPKAEPFYIKAMDIRKEALGTFHPDYASSLNNLAVLYRILGQHVKAEQWYKIAVAISKKALGETHPGFAQILNNIAELYVITGQYEKAATLHIEAMGIRKKALGEIHPDFALSLNNLGGVYIILKEYGKAEQLYIEAIDIRKKVLGEAHPDYAQSLNNLAFLYFTTGQYTKAEPLFIKAMDIWKKTLGELHADYATSLNNIAFLYESMGEYKKAETVLIQNSQVILKNLLSNFNIFSELEKENYLINNITLLESNNSFLYKNPKASESIIQNNFNLQLIFKSLTLTDTKNVLLTARQSHDSTVQRLLRDWEENNRILAKQYSFSLANRRSDIKELETQKETLEKELNRKSSEFRKQKNAVRISLPDIQKSLSQDDIAIEFVHFRLHNKKWTDSIIYAAYILTKNDSIPIFVPLCEEKQLQKLFDSAGTTATDMVSKFYRGLEIKSKNSAGALGTELYKLIWQPLEPYLKNVKKVSYSPAGKLYSIAFHALPVDSATVLMDKYQLQQYTSTRQVVLREQEKQNTKPQNIALFGDASFTLDSLQIVKGKIKTENISSNIYTPQNRGTRGGSWSGLPGTAQEVITIQQLFEKNKISTHLFVQTTASEENLKAFSGNSPQILHIATHGFFLPEPNKKRKENNFNNNENTYTLADDPLLRSGLILSGGNYAWSGKTPIEGVEDGVATAYEISQLNLSNTELVVLSACETALGDVKGSEGVFGLQRAFKMAGVKKMIVSLWQVPDKETAELMTTFYTYWMKGKTINDAFTQAQADMRKKYAPFYWAAFVLVE